MESMPSVSQEALLARLSADYRDGMLSIQQSQTECPSTTDDRDSQQTQLAVSPTTGGVDQPVFRSSPEHWGAGGDRNNRSENQVDSRAALSVSLRCPILDAPRSLHHSNQCPHTTCEASPVAVERPTAPSPCPTVSATAQCHTLSHRAQRTAPLYLRQVERCTDS